MMEFVDLQPDAHPTNGFRYPYYAEHRRRRDPEVQAYIHQARKSERYKVRCWCRPGGGLPLTAAVREEDGVAYVSRARDGAGTTETDQHSPHCFHADGDVSEQLGFNKGAVQRRGESLVLDWSCLFADTNDGGGGSGGSGKSVDHGQRLLGLLRLLICRAGMHVYVPNARPRALFDELEKEAADILVSKVPGKTVRSLADVLMRPDWGRHDVKRINQDLLADTAQHQRRRVLTLSTLGKDAHKELANPEGDKLKLFNQFGCGVTAEKSVVRKALAAHDGLRAWFNDGGKVLAMGLAAAFEGKGQFAGRVYGTVKHLALLPLHAWVPLSSVDQAHLLDRAMQRNEIYVSTLATADLG